MQVITLSEAALKHFKTLINSKRPDLRPAGILVGVKPSGCSGWMYTLEFLMEGSLAASPEYHCCEQAELLLVVKKSDFPVLEGTCIDYGGDELGMQLLFNNPRAKHTCGCGESFTIE